MKSDNMVCKKFDRDFNVKTEELALPEPTIENNLFFNITFKRDPQFSMNSTSSQLKKKSIGDLTDRQQAILEALNDDKLSSSEILEILEVSISGRTLRGELLLLKNKSYIDSEGAEGWARKWFVVKKFP